MPINFVPADGVNPSEANAYSTIALADEYALSHSSAAAWAALSDGILDPEDNQKAALLIGASRQIDGRCLWKGTKLARTQPLQWPRTGATDGSDAVVGDAEIPIEIMHASIELALRLIDKDFSAPNSEGVGALRRERIDVLELEYFEGGSRETLPGFVLDMIIGFARPKTSTNSDGTQAAELNTSSFASIVRTN